jgi:hypothetical protein
MVSAQVEDPAAAMAVTPLVRPLTSTGVGLGSGWNALVATPSWPLLSSPQHLTPPATVRAQVWLSPIAMAATPLVKPVTSSGVGFGLFVP